MNKTSEKGAALAITLMVMTVVGILGVSLSINGINESRLTRHRLNAAKAFWVAEGGVQAAFRDINANDCKGLKVHATQAACTSCDTCTGTNDLTGSLPNGEYSVTLTASNTRLVSNGSYPTTASPSAQRIIQADVGKGTLFSFAAFAQGQMTFANNAKVDSFNSDKGDYNQVLADGTHNIASNGDIGTNGTTAGIINLDNNVIINGDASTGAGGTVVQGAGATVSGNISHNTNIVLQPVVIPSEIVSLVSPGALVVASHSTTTLPTGDYKYSSISMGNGSTLVISGDARIYLTGNPALVGTNNDVLTINANASLRVYVDGVIDFNNNVSLNNLSETPSKFMILSTYTGAAGVSIKNNASFYGTIYAPTTDIVMENNAAIFGAMVGETVTVSNNDQVHFDEALNTLSDPNAALTVSNWQEL